MAWWLLWRERVQGADVAQLRSWSPGGASLSGGDFRGARMWGKALPRVDLSQANLTHADLRRTSLQRSQLQGARLNHADLRKANLDRADLSGAELVGVDLQGASLVDARLSGVLTRPHIPLELREVQQSHPVAELSGADLQGADLSGALLRGADLTKATLTWANLRGADLRDADLSGADLWWSDLRGSDLRGAELRGAALQSALYCCDTRWPVGFAIGSTGAYRLGVRFSGVARESELLKRIEVPGYGALGLIQAPPGTFWMGSSAADGDVFDDESPRHEVRMSRDFLIGQTPVTQGLYKLVMGYNPSQNQASDQHPVENVSWFDAARFCNTLSQRCGLESAYTIGSSESAVSCRFEAHGFRLPTEAEWEYAAKAGGTLKYSGSNHPKTVAWYQGNSGGKTRPVGQRKPNDWGIYDLSGNVYEWVWDWYDKHRYSHFSASGRSDPSGPREGRQRVLRGGAFSGDTSVLRATFRNMRDPRERLASHGLRVVFPVRSSS